MSIAGMYDLRFGRLRIVHVSGMSPMRPASSGMKTSEYRLEYRADFMPHHDAFVPGVIYVSRKYGIANFLCPCGCGSQVPTPIGNAADPHKWGMADEGGRVTFTPSIEMRHGCRSHYFIQGGKVVWC